MHNALFAPLLGQKRDQKQTYNLKNDQIMSKIQTFAPKNRLKSNELLAFARAVEEKVTASNPTTLNVSELFGIYKASLQALDDSMVVISKSYLTPEKQAADKVRDGLQSGLTGQIRIFVSHFDAGKQANARHLIPLADKFVGATQAPYEEQTGLTDNFVQELESDTYKTDVEALGLTQWVAELKKANQACARLSSEQAGEKGARNTSLKLSDTRPIFEANYDALVTRFNALAEVNGDSSYHELFVWWNALIDRYRILLANRLGAGKGGTTDKGASNRPTPGSDEDDRPEIE